MMGYNELGKPIRKTFYGDTREDVARQVVAATNNVFNGTVAVEMKKDLTVAKMINDFLWTFKKPSVSDVTFEWYLNIAKAHIIPELGMIPVIELTPHIIQTQINRMYEKERLSVRTIKTTRDILNQTYNHAVEVKQVAMNPVSGTKLPNCNMAYMVFPRLTGIYPVRFSI